ncbi:MAG: carbohydrate ABC transporter permease [Chloroflexota bacterium]
MAERGTIREWLTAVLFIGPNVALLAVFSFWPLIQNVSLSFVEWDLIAPEKRWVGLANWAFVLGDSAFRQIALNTAVFTIGSVGLTITLGLAVALLLNQPLRGRNAVRTAIFAPTVLSGSAIALVWIYMFDPSFGLIRAILGWFGIGAPRWLTDPAWAMPAVIIVYVWKHLGYSVVILLAGLQSIPRELYEAARVDGANSWQRLWAVTLPGLGPVTFFLLVTSVLASFQAFDLIRVMTSGGPVLATTTLIYQLYYEGFVGFHAGIAAVYALVLFALMFALTALQFRYVERRVTYV